MDARGDQVETLIEQAEAEESMFVQSAQA